MRVNSELELINVGEREGHDYSKEVSNILKVSKEDLKILSGMKEISKLSIRNKEYWRRRRWPSIGLRCLHSSDL